MSEIAVLFEDPPARPGKKWASLLGPGSLAIDGGMVRIRGVRPRKWLPRAVGFVAGTAVMILAAWILVVLGLERWVYGKLALAIGLVFWMLPWYLVTDLLKRRLCGFPVDRRLPLARVRLEEKQQARLVLDLDGERIAARPVAASDHALLAQSLDGA